jgi:hypothetical protein
MQQGLFLKMFTWFWLTVILTGVAIEGTSAYARRSARSVGAKFEKLLPDAARTAAATLETKGEAALAAYLSELQRRQSVMAYFFDVRGDERTHRWTPAAIRKEGFLATREPGVQRSGNQGEIAAVHVMGERGNNYAMVLVMPRSASSAAWSLPAYWRLVAIVLISGVFCFLIARHVATPVLGLQAAAAGIAAGHLDMRVSAKLQRRGDEIARITAPAGVPPPANHRLPHSQPAHCPRAPRSPAPRSPVPAPYPRRKMVKDPAEHLVRNSNAVIPHTDQHAPTFPLHRNLDLATLRRRGWLGSGSRYLSQTRLLLSDEKRDYPTRYSSCPQAIWPSNPTHFPLFSFIFR